MTLSKYKKKRNFKSTTEPEGKLESSKNESIFVVQKHDASHLHYDFRLEAQGVLKSWAVPKGPSTDPSDKRLAMMVEDHPYSYKDFEGTIAEGNYGAGNVIVWDNGTYFEINSKNKKESDKNIAAGIKKGHISFILKGKKLKGEFTLVKTRGRAENAWLLIKKNDKHADKDDILLKDRSVISHKKLVPRERKSSAKKRVSKPEPKKTVADKKKAKATKEDYRPMMAKTIDKPFDNNEWIFEIKYDGYRAVAIIDKEVQLLSRNLLSFNKLFSPIADELGKIKHQVVLDGEVVVEDQKGRSSFQLLQNYQQTGSGSLKYYVFDLLHMDGNDLRQMPLLQRKELLQLFLKNYKLKNVFFSEHIAGTGKAFYESAIEHNLEGIVAKDAISQYYSGKRSGEWLKIKISQQDEAIIAGFTSPKGSRSHFGSLILGAYKNGEFVYTGNCGTGFNDKTLKEIYNKLKPYFISESPFKEKIKFIGGKPQWVKPHLVCQVKFTEWTSDGHMRHPVFLGLRVDKEVDDVTVPDKKKVPKKKTSEKVIPKKADKKLSKSEPKEKGRGNFDLKVGKTILHLTNQDKIYFPDDKITKGDIVNYYDAVSSYILPYLKDRPQSMNRFPNGIKGPSFYQKDVDLAKSPEWISTHKIFSESNKKHIDYLICNDKTTLLYMANLGCIEINPWNSRVGNEENPDWVVIDLDPEEIAFKHVVTTALEVKKVMDELKVDCYCKTSGATGLHIFAPLGGKYDYDLVKTFAEMVATNVHQRLPEITSILRSPAKRKNKVYVDFLQNRRGQTLAAPYSARPKPGATVSTPLEWKEVNEKLDPKNFTIKNTLERLKKKGDLWKPVIGKGVDLEKVIKKIYKSLE